jgi:hypothetical protein
MDMSSEFEILRSKGRETALHIAITFLDCLFLALWAYPNVLVERWIVRLHVQGIDEVILRCMQVFFGVSTLAPICISLYKDIRLMVKRANRDIDSDDPPDPPPPAISQVAPSGAL